MKVTGIFISVLVLVTLGFVGFNYVKQQRFIQAVDSFTGCVDAGYPILTSKPPRCTTPDGRTFVEDVGSEMDFKDDIQVDSPQSNQKITSPFPIRGKARGGWYFEGSFSAEVYDMNGKQLGTVILSASDNWMTSEFVPFTGKLYFSEAETSTGTLKLHGANPSGLKENDRDLIIPVRF